MMLMKNERCLIKKIIEFNERIVKICLIFIGLTFLMGFYDERNIYVDLEEITVELGDRIPNEQMTYINNHLINSNFFLEDSVPKDVEGQTTKIGTFNYYIVYRDEERMYSRLTNKRSTISVIDTIKPEIKLKETSPKFEYGSKIDINQLAVCYDLSVCNLSFKDKIDTKKVGVQEVVIVAIDEGNNISEKNINITIKDKPKVRYYSSGYPSIDSHNTRLNEKLSYEQKMAKRNSLINFAKLFEGNPYVYGGTSLTNGTDCSGFTMSVYANFGYKLPRSALSQGYVGKPVSRGELLPGDLIVYRYPGGGGHVGIFIGGNKMIHAGTEKTGIVIASIFEGNKVYRRIIY